MEFHFEDQSFQQIWKATMVLPGHGEQDAAHALQDGLDAKVDGNLLEVVRLLAGGQVDWGQQALGSGFVSKPFGSSETSP